MATIKDGNLYAVYFPDGTEVEVLSTTAAAPWAVASVEKRMSGWYVLAIFDAEQANSVKIAATAERLNLSVEG